MLICWTAEVMTVRGAITQMSDLHYCTLKDSSDNINGLYRMCWSLSVLGFRFGHFCSVATPFFGQQKQNCSYSRQRSRYFPVQREIGSFCLVTFSLKHLNHEPRTRGIAVCFVFGSLLDQVFGPCVSNCPLRETLAWTRMTILDIHYSIQRDNSL